ncbi:hypothetical protein E2P86_00735 [Sphingobacterium psychroaquaticum]|uniref:DUF5683 domain-containing protein n=1 Tax=Sphingobacterium psychroaquaticum TaxID=561061 RepID=UPI00106CC8CE|nr:DUF5683 domain-containing protein [Sphingobacterium psychroaquaticum]QBQ39756.1 hypothetical protein E2P86_00735 [Sphingobacterium psychroaquaticum]
MRHIIATFLVLFAALTAVGQEVRPVRVDSLGKKEALQDSTAGVGAAQDSVKKETRKERKAREKAEKEHEKYYYNGIKKDSARLEIEHLSRIAWRRSLMVPGWGQYTNKGLWWVKVPVIYGGFVGAYLVFDYWQWYYKLFLNELDYRIANNGQPDPDGQLQNWRDTNSLIQQKDYARRNRDLTILVTAGWWGLNVIEAYADSMLKNRWNIGRDMKMKVTPTVLPTTGGNNVALNGFGVVPGLKLTMTLN